MTMLGKLSAAYSKWLIDGTYKSRDSLKNFLKTHKWQPIGESHYYKGNLNLQMLNLRGRTSWQIFASKIRGLDYIGNSLHSKISGAHIAVTKQFEFKPESSNDRDDSGPGLMIRPLRLVNQIYRQL